MSENKGYNGWSNYETWNVALWMDNDEGSYLYWKEQAVDALSQNDNEKDDAASDLARLLKDEHEENTPTVTGCYADLLNAALSEVDWYEIAEHLIEDNYEASEPDTDDDEAQASA